MKKDNTKWFACLTWVVLTVSFIIVALIPKDTVAIERFLATYWPVLVMGFLWFIAVPLFIVFFFLLPDSTSEFD